MKKFQFKLQPLLKFRQYQERLAQQQTAKAHMDVKNSEQEIKTLEKTWDDQADAIEGEVQKGISGPHFQQYYQYLTAVESNIAMEKIKKVELEKVLQEKLLELKKKSVDKRAMELYQEKLKNQYIQEMIHIEQKELDEVSTLKTARKRK